MINKDRAYRILAERISISKSEYLNRAENDYYPAHERYRAWLQLLGLIETWTIV